MIPEIPYTRKEVHKPRKEWQIDAGCEASYVLVPGVKGGDTDPI